MLSSDIFSMTICAWMASSSRLCSRAFRHCALFSASVSDSSVSASASSAPSLTSVTGATSGSLDAGSASCLAASSCGWGAEVSYLSRASMCWK